MVPDSDGTMVAGMTIEVKRMVVRVMMNTAMTVMTMMTTVVMTKMTLTTTTMTIMFTHNTHTYCTCYCTHTQCTVLTQHSLHTHIYELHSTYYRESLPFQLLEHWHAHCIKFYIYKIYFCGSHCSEVRRQEKKDQRLSSNLGPTLCRGASATRAIGPSHKSFISHCLMYRHSSAVGMHTPNIYLATIYSEQVKHVRYHQEPQQSHRNVWVRMYHITLYKSPCTNHLVRMNHLELMVWCAVYTNGVMAIRNRMM